jgi:hypothetical protein
MDVHIDPDGAPRLVDAETLTSLRLTGTAPSLDARAALASAGIVITDDGGHGFIEPATFSRLAGALAADPAWQQGLATMVAFATDKGWTDEAGRIRAHAEWDG